jgi:sporulation-control protein
MAQLGIGSASIDLVLEKEAYQPGESVKGHFSIEGGIIQQKLKRIDCHLILVEKTTGIEKIMGTATILTSKQIDSEEMHNLPFAFQLPASTLPSSNELNYHFQTELIFNEGITSQDQDKIQIVDPDSIAPNSLQ